MNLIINGQQKEMPDNLTLSALLTELRINPLGVAVELNLKIIPKTDYAKTQLKENDKLEIISFVGGG
ncbi:MAG: sulfur carrier protein ThiS [Planctomycetes bacterium]|nr:sulfur carrier protein ThiS [Planctomycetota bacterium]